MTMHTTFLRPMFVITGTLIALFVTTSIVFATDTNTTPYTPMVGLPGFTNQESRSLSEYINLVYITLIALGALIALFKISIAGAKYMMNDSFNTKSEAKSDIKGALLGLAILIIPYIVLNTIYSGLTRTDVFDNNETRVELRKI